jgi:hypothetical protein
MADNWNAEFKRHIAPGDPGSYRETTDGKFVFVAPIEGSDVYDIKYTDGDRRGSMQYVVNAGDCVSCDCGKISYKAPSGKISSNGGNNVTLGTNFKITHAYCEKNYNATFEAVENVSNVHLDGTTIKGNVPSNNGEEREIKFNVRFNGHVCPNTDKYNLKQEHGCTCANSSYSYNPSVSSVGAEGYSGTIGTISMNHGCGVGRVGVTSSNMSVSRSGNNIVATIPQNTGPATSFSYSITLDGSVCSGPYTIAQGAGCMCSNFSFNCNYTDNDRYIGVQAQTLNLGTYSMSEGCSVEARSLTDGLTIRVVGNTVYGDVTNAVTGDRMSRRLQYAFYVNGNQCGGVYELYQNLVRGTDDGTDLYGDGSKTSHPILLDWDETSFCDSIIASSGAYLEGYYDENGTYHALTRRKFDGSFTSPVQTGDWMSVQTSLDGDCNCAGRYGVQVNATVNNTDRIRTITVLLSSNDDAVVPSSCGCDICSQRPGEPILRQWEWEVKQAPRGKGWCCPSGNSCHGYEKIPCPK